MILSEKAYIENQINSLVPSTTSTSKMNLVTLSRTHLTLSMIDGKVINIITNSKSQLKCPICKLTASDFNQLELAFSKPNDTSTLQNGISPFHAWIMAYKNDSLGLVRVWRVRKNTPAAKVVDERKKIYNGNDKAKTRPFG